MFSKFVALAATVAVAAATFDGDVREEQEFWSQGDLHQASHAKLGSLNQRTQGLSDGVPSIVAGVKLVQSNIGRINGMVKSLSDLRGDTVAAQQATEYNMHGALSTAEWKDGAAEATATAAAAVQRAQALIKIDGISGALKAATSLAAMTQNKLDKEMKAKASEITKAINAKLTAVKPANYFSENHIKQVTGYASSEASKYWDGKTYTSTADEGEVKGRKFYKVKYNIKSRGYWTSNSNELFMACRALSNHLRSKDGKERDLRPPCNHYNHRRTGGLGQCVWIRRSYFSHSHNGGGYWGFNQAGGGIREEVLRNTAGYEQNNHNNDHHLVHRGPNSHTWVKAYRSHAYEYTMCTSGNRFYKE